MNTNNPSFYYDGFYSKGGWKYSKWREKRFLLKRIIRPLRLSKNMKLLEIGCGMGFHSNLFSELDFEVTGVDMSEIAIVHAREHYHKPTFLCLDAKELSRESESFDIIYIRGMSWYHYELNGINRNGIDVPSCTRQALQLLKKGGVFILQIWTDFSGIRPDNQIHYNKLEDYVKLFEQFGKVILVSDWKGAVLESDSDAQKSSGGIIIATLKKV